MPNIAITSDFKNQQTAKQFAIRCQVPFIDDAIPSRLCPFHFVLIFNGDKIALFRPQEKKNIFYVDFCAKQLRYRSKMASLRNEMLAKVMGVSPKKQPAIVDATAGLGQDSFILASLGFNVTLLERSAYIHLLLANGLQRSKKDPLLMPIIERMQLIEADGISWLKNHKQAHIIYLDPMFPPRKKNCAVKKEMAWLRSFIGDEIDTTSLFQTALACASNRVVVKRPRLADFIADRPPNFSHHGRSCRFDIYLA